GGAVQVAVEPAILTPYPFAAQGALRHVSGIAHVGNLSAQVAERMRHAALQVLGEGSPVHIESQVLSKPRALGTGGAIVLWAEMDGTVLGAGRVAQRGVPAESLGTEAARELVADLRAGATLDLHAADQLLIYLALSGHGSYVTRTLTRHAQTAMWLIEQFLPVRFTTACSGDLVTVHVRKRP
ncbi:MAG TPA: RNA 3'-terminal phosphate cyclase, partial [Burkholderiales bacterium]|nr:RNA 3'-terminal phosphate cyclase [Burkholderiales bacterium]